MSKRGSDNKHGQKLLLVLMPIAISLASLIFGAYQYFDKRTLETKLNELKIMAARKEQSDMTVHYVQADLESFHTIGDFDTAMLSWAKRLERVLPFATNVRILDNQVYKELRDYHGEVKDHMVSFLLIRNSGGSRAKNIRFELEGTVPENKELLSEKIAVEELAPGDGCIVVTGHHHAKSNERYGRSLSPGLDLQWFDVFLEEEKSLPIRRPYETATLVTPRIEIRP
jgi:hypothetical protein